MQVLKQPRGPPPSYDATVENLISQVPSFPIVASENDQNWEHNKSTWGDIDKILFSFLEFSFLSPNLLLTSFYKVMGSSCMETSGGRRGMCRWARPETQKEISTTKEMECMQLVLKIMLSVLGRIRSIKAVAILHCFFFTHCQLKEFGLIMNDNW